MVKLFIDANVFLQFFREDMPRFHNLVESLLELRPHLLITERVAAEVRRNKVRVAASAFSVLEKQLAFPAVRLPEHLDDTDNDTLHQLNEDLAQLLARVRDATTCFRLHRDQLLRRIATSEDQTSKKLERLFENAAIPTDDQLARARQRRRYGDPPGKPGDPLGDQLSWEQVLDEVSAHNDVWLVTRDTDYFEDIGGELLLNPFLARELSQRAPNRNARVFSKLVNALQSIRESIPEVLQSDLTVSDVEAIRQEEDLKGTSFATPLAATNIARALRELSNERSPNESILHYLLRGEDVTSYGEAVKRGHQKILERAGVLEGTEPLSKKDG